jgi:hypothetical protein
VSVTYLKQTKCVSTSMFSGASLCPSSAAELCISPTSSSDSKYAVTVVISIYSQLFDSKCCVSTCVECMISNGRHVNAIE